jgi:hypothetical protein
MPKILVINGHGVKLMNKISIYRSNRMITPGPAESNYVVVFDNMERHLEEMTSQDKIWPINQNGSAIKWHRYQDIAVNDMSISPLQSSFDFTKFAHSVLSQTTQWESLTKPPHNVLEHGALAVKYADQSIVVLDKEELRKYLEQAVTHSHLGTPIFFCDKKLGKVKPMADTTLTDIFAGIARISDFTIIGTETIVMACSSADGQPSTRIVVQTNENATDIVATPFINVSAPKVTTPPKPRPKSPVTPPMRPIPSIAPATLADFEQKFSIILAQLSMVQTKLSDRKLTNSNYEEAASAAALLCKTLTDRKNKFMENPTAPSMKDFRADCVNDIEQAQKIFKMHRGWHQIDPLIRKLLGVLALLTIIPALVVRITTKHGYLGTFFETPETDTAIQVASTLQEFSSLTEKLSTAVLDESRP